MLNGLFPRCPGRLGLARRRQVPISSDEAVGEVVPPAGILWTALHHGPLERVWILEVPVAQDGLCTQQSSGNDNPQSPDENRGPL